MGRKTQISKEQMLQAAYEILRDEGYASVNIKAIAAKVGCSTQPISWQFGNMQGLRAELFGYATQQLYGGLPERMAGKNALGAFFESGKLYIENAYDFPKVFRFLCVDDPGDLVADEPNVLDKLGEPAVKEMLVSEFDLTPEAVDKVVADIVIYTHGLATFLLWDHFKITKEQAFDMVYSHGDICFKQIGIDAEKYF